MGLKDIVERLKTLESGGSTVASALGTTGASVNVNLAAPPVAGQVLTATSAVLSTWQTPGASGGDSITVNGVAVVDADFDSSTPAAPANGRNVVFQKDAGSPANISAHVLGDGVATNFLRGDGTFAALSPLNAIPAPVASVDFVHQQSLQFRIENRTTDPASPAVGEIWLRTNL